MKLIDFLKTANEEDILNCEVFRTGLDIGHNHEYFNESRKCPYECKYLEKSYDYECESFNGMCETEYDPTIECPYNINREEVISEQIIEWLNMEV